MKFFITTRVTDVADEKWLKASKQMEPAIIKMLENKNYGTGITQWVYIFIILPFKFKEEIKRDQKSQLKFVLVINYDKFLNADDQEAIKLLCESMQKSFKIAKEKLKIEDFDIYRFEADMLNLFYEKQWN